MSDVKMRSAARSASGPLKNHFRSGLSSQIPTDSRTVWCSAIGSPKSRDPVPALPLGERPAQASLHPVEPGLQKPLGRRRPAGGGSEIPSVAPAPMSKGAAMASIGGIGTSTGMITVGVARRVSS